LWEDDGKYPSNTQALNRALHFNNVSFFKSIASFTAQWHGGGRSFESCRIQNLQNNLATTAKLEAERPTKTRAGFPGRGEKIQKNLLPATENHQ
jgi:hypothetical protein